MTKIKNIQKNQQQHPSTSRVEVYNVLWLDDRYENQIEFSMMANDRGINLISFRTLEAGFDYLEENLSNIDAILLDTTFFMDKDDELAHSISKSIKALSYAVDRINQLSSKKLFPYFIFTSNSAYENDNTFISTYEKYYRKYNKEDIERLFTDIRTSVKREIDAIIRNKYADIFEIFTDKYIGAVHQPTLFDILKNFENSDNVINSDVYYNPLRKILEAIFVMFNRYGVIPNSCFKEVGEPNIMYCSLYLSGKEIRFGGGRFTKAKEIYFPQIIQNHVWNIVSYTNIGSHNEAQHKKVISEIAELRNSGVNSPYLLYVITFEMLDVILWAKAFMDERFLNNRQYRGRGRR